MKGYQIAIVNSSSFGKWYLEHVERLQKIGKVSFFQFPEDIDGRTLAKKLFGYNIIISSVTPSFSKEFFDYKDETLLISRHGIGYNNIDITAATEKKTKVAIVSPLVERDAVAENAISNLMMLVRKSVDSVITTRNDGWNQRASFLGNTLTGKTFGVVGCGNIGTRVAEIFKNGFNGNVIVNDPKENQEWAKKHSIKYVTLEELLFQADIISLNASLDGTSHHILNKKTFAKMKRGVYITNAARGALVCEEDLLEAIEVGIVKGLATDVMIEEPANHTHPYFNNKQILITPHTSAYTAECLKGMGNKCVLDVENMIQGKKIECLVNP
ncbi:D-isomer specific 2-hydroxyacid dehydrogenase family protein [Enterococcus dongliensis]|uniref:D-isomer specific 2-hydroxyacid dehydrogenase family protein n=1 Tax=Enterococcus dongliensis TaxID=2559925 RepID=UPI0028913655|nr:D-isomer specific 2-hydroxyacid dehydrogenase family protein [Enterococcus dongliensis]MDT2612878.1 D-isomer specific 2-hydroxyacid dehydrogenase family protein [Enterococcus dongliensis]